MEYFDKPGALEQVPIIYVRGTNYQIGLAMGRTFGGMIRDFYANFDFFNNEIVPTYATAAGKQKYEDTLRLCELKFPRYMEEVRGLAEGASVPFDKVFMLHIDSLMTVSEDEVIKQTQADSGCTSVLCNADEVVLAQNEDAFPELINGFYIVVADVTDAGGNRLEKFAALTYSGLLPGCSMGLNSFGLVHSVNTLVAKHDFPKGSPRWFVTRALLGASSLEDLIEIVTDKGTGVADGFSLNLCIMSTAKGKTNAEAKMYNIEVAPPKPEDTEDSKTRHSQVSVHAVQKGESYVHCNRYLHLKVPEIEDCLTSTIHRHAAISKLPFPSNVSLVKDVVSDQSDPEYPVYRRFQKGDKDGAKTVATGIFDIGQRKWFIYVRPPNKSDAIAVLSMDL